MLNRKQRRQNVKFQNKLRLWVTDGAFGNSKNPRIPIKGWVRTSKAINDKNNAAIQKKYSWKTT